jgi:pantetheine-phosphate adenylyltransferase
MKKTAIFPGSFDPITLGHESIVRSSIKLLLQLDIMLVKIITFLLKKEKIL